MHAYFSGLITSLTGQQCFVFGSNRHGVHGAGAARQAYEQFGAEWGVGEGPTGKCYALPTKDHAINTLCLLDIAKHVNRFLDYARRHPDITFLVTPIGCGLAGYDASQIGPMFRLAPDNCILHVDLKVYADQQVLNFEEGQ